jgi:hypothetical protein
MVATEYAAAGYAVVVDDTLEDQHDDDAYAVLGARKIFLAPRLDVALARNATRTNKPPGDAPHLDVIARRLYEPMRRAHTAARGWLVVDSSALDIAATLDVIREYGD